MALYFVHFNHAQLSSNHSWSQLSWIKIIVSLNSFSPYLASPHIGCKVWWVFTLFTHFPNQYSFLPTALGSLQYYLEWHLIGWSGVNTQLLRDPVFYCKHAVEKLRMWILNPVILIWTAWGLEAGQSVNVRDLADAANSLPAAAASNPPSFL